MWFLKHGASASGSIKEASLGGNDRGGACLPVDYIIAVHNHPRDSKQCSFQDNPIVGDGTQLQGISGLIDTAVHRTQQYNVAIATRGYNYSAVHMNLDWCHSAVTLTRGE